MIKRRWQLWILCLTLAAALAACKPAAAKPAPESKTLLVFAAASLTHAFDELGTNFEAAHPGVRVNFNFGGSQTLRTQIEQGAPADVFASANAKEMDALVTGNFIRADSVNFFLANYLVVIMPAGNPAGLRELADLSQPGLKLILAAKEVPAGSYAGQALERMDAVFGEGFKESVLANVVSYENDVRQVVAKIQLGEADAGIVYISDATAAPELQRIEIPDAYNLVAQYPLAVLAQSAQAELSQAFVAYVLSPTGQAILQKWGFLPVQ